jgi:hypothetical protein
MKVLYTAGAVVEGGRAGHGRTSDGQLAVELPHVKNNSYDKKVAFVTGATSGIG